MKKIIAFLKMSNRYKHLIGGLMVGLLGFTPWTAFYAWDWIDWSLTVIGGILSALFWWIV